MSHIFLVCLVYWLSPHETEGSRRTQCFVCLVPCCSPKAYNRAWHIHSCSSVAPNPNPQIHLYGRMFTWGEYGLMGPKFWDTSSLCPQDEWSFQEGARKGEEEKNRKKGAEAVPVPYLPRVVYKTQSFLVEEGREVGEMWGQVCLCLLLPSSSVSNRRGIPDTFTCKTSENPYFTSALATFVSVWDHFKSPNLFPPLFLAVNFPVKHQTHFSAM